MKKVFVLGLDCAAPAIVLDRKVLFPNLCRLIDTGVSAPFRSIHPPITVPAWMAMVTGKDAGDLGIYGFRHRVKGSYNDLWLSMADKFTEPKIWDIISKAGLKSCLVGVPPSYPPSAVNGNMVSCFMTPSADKEYTYPPALKDELEEKFGPYIYDIKFRTNDRDQLKEDLFKMTLQHIEIVKYLMVEKPWDFFMHVEIGVDRAHHAFWKFYDKDHQGYEPGNKYENVMLEYYSLLDKGIGEIIDRLDKDTVLFIVSDHGAKPMKGTFCINQWLIEQGYLTLNDNRQPTTDTQEPIISIEQADVDWSKTKVWAWGGYYSRIFFNVMGRENKGTILPFRYEAWRDKLIKELAHIKGPNGEEWQTHSYRPEELFENPKGDFPDLMVYLDDLSWRAGGTIGHDSMYLSENDTGPDDAVHDWNGIFIMNDLSKESKPVRLDRVNLLDFAPTVLNIMECDAPNDMHGTVRSTSSK